jgi:hypothetical protein
MQARVDKRLIEILNAMGVEITWKQFRDAYNTRRAERSQVRSKRRPDPFLVIPESVFDAFMSSSKIN